MYASITFFEETPFFSSSTQDVTLSNGSSLCL